MFYTTEKRDHGLPHDPFKALVVPRPIGWVSTISDTGVPNIAPFSFFNALSDYPPMLIMSVANGKDSVNNILATGECTCSLATKALVEEMNMSSAAVDTSVSEFDIANIETTESQMVSTPRVAASPAAFECKLWKSIELPLAPGPRPDSPDTGYTSLIVSVVGVYIDDQYVVDGMGDTAAMQPIARRGYMDYSVVSADNMFSLNRPNVSEDGKTATLKSGPWDGQYR